MIAPLQAGTPIEMFDELTRKIDQLSMNSERLQSILRVVNLGIMLHGPGTEMLVCNETALKMLDVDESQLLNKNIEDLIQVVVNREGMRIRAEDFPVCQSLRTCKSIHNVLMGFVRPLKRDIIWLSVSDDPVFHSDGTIKYVISSMIDISEQVRTENELKSSEDKWKFALEGNGDGVWDWDIKTNKCTYSSSYLEMLGYVSDDFSRNGDWENKIHPDDRPLVLKTLFDHVNGVSLKPYRLEYRVLCADDSYKWILGRGKVMSRDENGTGTRMIGTHMDISDSRIAEELLRHSLHEKDILLSEIHHRVKNNMAVVSGLLNLQEDYFIDDHSRSLFLESQNRIKSMALIHEKLYESDNFSYIGFETYIRDLIQTIEYSYNDAQKTICIETEVVNGFLDLKNAVPCALILNELLSNVYKHAFKNKAGGKVIVRFINIDHEYLMEVQDNGVGMDISMMKMKGSLGFTLVESLVKQLKGNLSMSSVLGQGSCSTIKFFSKSIDPGIHS